MNKYKKEQVKCIMHWLKYTSACRLRVEIWSVTIYGSWCGQSNNILFVASIIAYNGTYLYNRNTSIYRDNTKVLIMYFSILIIRDDFQTIFDKSKMTGESSGWGAHPHAFIISQWILINCSFNENNFWFV